MIPPALIQARAHFQAGRLAEARQLLRRFLQRDPGHAEANHSLAVLLFQLGQREQALYHAQRATAAAPDVGDYFIPLASIHDALGQRDKALAAAAIAARRAESSAELLLELIPLYWGMGEFDLALSTAERALGVNATLARGPYANVLCHIGEVERAIAHLRSQLITDPAARDVLGALISTLNYSPNADPAEVFSLHRRFGETFAAVPKVPLPAHARHPEERLRIGIISPDLYSQSVAFFAEPIIRHLDRRGFEIYCYSSCSFPDATTQRLKSLADAWRDIAGLSDAAVLQKLRDDAPHILIELAGATAGSVLSIMAARPAPIQVTAIGYPNTTGLSQIDYRLVDAITDPPGADAFNVERLSRLPGCFLCYQPPVDAPAPAPPTSRPITFGSFNVVQKLSAPTIDTWTRLLNQIPNSRLILKATQFSSPSIRDRFTTRFRDAGLDPSRLELLGPIKSKSDHLAAYDRVDIALDPFPYNGTTTTCEALLMGVPVVTLAGQVHAARVGASLLTAIGTPELIAATTDDYISIAATLAADTPRLNSVKQSLRPRLLASPLCDGPRYASAFGDALRAMWQARCSSPSA